jgi:TRAP-type uncharacterized transport system substrate-binding protein
MARMRAGFRGLAARMTIPPSANNRLLPWLQNKIMHSIGFGLVLLTVISLAVFQFSDFRKPKPDVVRIAYSAGGPVRKHFLEEMALHGRAVNLDIQLVATGSTDATLSLIDKKSVDMGLIAGGIEDHAKRNVQEITPLYVEPLQLVVKADLFEAVSRDFGQLKGRSIGMDGADSATNVMATELLRFIGLNDPVTGAPQYRRVNIPQAQLRAMPDDAVLPDAIFQIGGVPSATIEYLVAHHNYRLVALPFGGAFNLSKFREGGVTKPAEGERLGLNKAFVEEGVVPAFVYDVLPAVPATDTRTIASRLLLVGSPDLKNEIVQRMLTLVMSPDISHVVEPKLTPELLDAEFQFERHPGTDAYLASLKPMNVESALESYRRLAEIWGILAAFYLAVANGWKWVQERRDRRRKHSVGEYLGQVLAVEADVHGAPSEADRRLLDQRLSEIKKEAIELHLEGRLEDAENLQSLLVSLADTRTRIWGAAT